MDGTNGPALEEETKDLRINFEIISNFLGIINTMSILLFFFQARLENAFLTTFKEVAGSMCESHVESFQKMFENIVWYNFMPDE